MLLEEDGEAVVADPDGLGGGREGQLVVAARVAEDLPARAAVMLQKKDCETTEMGQNHKCTCTGLG